MPNDQFPDEFDSEQVYHMLMKNFNRIYHGSMSDFGEWQEGNRAPWGLYMHAAWFFGDNYWHFEGYLKFIKVNTDNFQAYLNCKTHSTSLGDSQLPGHLDCSSVFRD